MTNLPTELREKRDKKGFNYRKDPINNSYWDSDGCDPLDIFIDGYNQCFEDMLPLVEALKTIGNARIEKTIIDLPAIARKTLKEVLGDE